MTVTPWFDGPDLQEPREVEFVEALVQAASEGVFAGVNPPDTLRVTQPKGYSPGVMVGLVLPKVTCERRVVRVCYEAGDPWTPPMLQSDWSEGMYPRSPPGAYDGPTNDTDLWVSGIAATPTACAEWVTAWFVAQLARPVVRREWDRPATGPGSTLLGQARQAVATEWYLTKPEEFLDSRGTFGRWGLIRRAPSREVGERP